MPTFLSLPTETDVVVLAVPLTPATRGLVDYVTFSSDSLMAHCWSMFRVGRSSTPTRWCAELQSGRLNAALDVTDPEPLPSDHPLWTVAQRADHSPCWRDTSAFARVRSGCCRRNSSGLPQATPLANVVVGSPRAVARR